MLYIYLSEIDSQEKKDIFTKLYEDNRNYMYHIAYHILYDASASENIVHDAFVRIIENMNKFDFSNEHKAKGLLGIMVSGLAKNEYRRRKKVELFDELPKELDYMSATLEDEVIGQDQYEKLVELIKSMEDIYSDILIMKIVYGMPYDDIALFLGITEEMVRQRYHRARVKLKEDIIKEGLDI